MSTVPEPPEVAALRSALAVTPENVPLRQLLAEALLRYNLAAPAVQEFREALRRAPQNQMLKLGLARSFHAEGKTAEAIVLLEAVTAEKPTPAAAHLLLARFLCENGELQRAAGHARQARQLDPMAHDPDLDTRLEPFLRPLASGDKDPSAPPSRAAGKPSLPADDDSVIDEFGRVRAPGGNQPGEMAAEIERPSVAFNDVGGMDGVKEQIRMKIIHPLAHAELFKAYGKKTGGGVLLYGPPGCGKTHLARATAGEVRAAFLSIGLHEVLSMWLGQSEQNLHQLFDQARRNRPAVLFVDEVDALGANRSDLRQSAGRNLINQFLAEMDGIEANNDGLLILAATNAPWHLDPAFRRPGRFDHLVFVPPPDENARAAILRVMLRGKPVADVDYSAIAHKTEGFSGADLKGLLDRCIEAKLTAAMKLGRVEPLTTKDLLAAAKGTKPSTLEWFSTAKNYALYANQGGQYDEVLSYMKLKH